MAIELPEETVKASGLFSGKGTALAAFGVVDENQRKKMVNGTDDGELTSHYRVMYEGENEANYDVADLHR